MTDSPENVCTDCGRAKPEPALVAAGGFYDNSVVLPMIYEFKPKPWYCDDCRAKYPEPVEYETTCFNCEGRGIDFEGYCCEGCDHSCTREVQCHICKGTGLFMDHDCNPRCDHSFSLPLFSVARGGIEFS